MILHTSLNSFLTSRIVYDKRALTNITIRLIITLNNNEIIFLISIKKKKIIHILIIKNKYFKKLNKPK